MKKKIKKEINEALDYSYKSNFSKIKIYRIQMLQKNKSLKNMSYADAILSATKIMLKKNKKCFCFWTRC